MNTSFSPDLYLSASAFAADAHAGQTVPGNKRPYLLHVTQVAAEAIGALIAEGDANPDLLIACALLHDTVEDTNVTKERLAETFGDAVADGVLALTKDASLPGEDRMADSLRRIQAQPKSVWKVKLCDRIVNLQPPPSFWVKEKIEKYADEAEKILDALGDASPHLANRLRERIDAYRANFG